MKQARTIGNNIKLLLQERGVSYEDLANALDYDYIDIAKICDGRLVVMDEDLEEIADYFDVPVDYLFEEKSKELYSGKLFVYHMHTFKQDENKQKILDIFDYYCDLKEAIAINR